MVSLEQAAVRGGANGQVVPRAVVRAQLAELQRARLLSAIYDVVGECGAANASVSDVVERSGVSRRTFYELFEDRDECFLAAFEQTLELVSKRVLLAYESGRGWREQIRCALGELLCFLDEEPLVGRVLVVESLSFGAPTLARRGEVLERVTRAVDDGRAECKRRPPAALTAEGIVGGLFGVIHARMAAASGEPLAGLTGQLMSMIVLPYLGAAAAAHELELPAPVPVSTPERLSHAVRLLEDPFKAAGMRLTYRTVRVLSAIAESPNASNRMIAVSAGVEDQGQISKLLGRLERIGLIVNAVLGPGTGGPNAWALTDTGRQVVERIGAYGGDEL